MIEVPSRKRRKAVTDKSYLSAINKIVETSGDRNSVVKLTEEQKLMQELSNDDIKILG